MISADSQFSAVPFSVGFQFSAESFSAGSQFSAVKIITTSFYRGPATIRGPTLLRLLSHGKGPRPHDKTPVGLMLQQQGSSFGPK